MLNDISIASVIRSLRLIYAYLISNMAFSSEPLPRKKKRKLLKKQCSKNKGHSLELSACNITGIGGTSGDDFGGVDFGLGNELDCLNELASAQVGDSPPSTSGNKNTAAAEEIIQMPQSQPPSLDEIPNLRVELARHLQVESLSSFLLQSCPGLRMPTFERWLLDSKLEESDRMQSIADNWAIDPSIKLQLKNKKKKYGRAALHLEENATQGREDARTMRESRILLDAERSTNNNNSEGDTIDRLAKKAKALIDPVLPGNPLDSDQSSKRLVDEIVANSTKMSDDNDDDDMNMNIKGKAEEIVGELLSRCIESVKEIQQLQNRFGMYQQLSFLNKAAKNSSSSSGLVRVEWPSGKTPEDSVCSLSYITTKKKSSSASTSDSTGESKKKAKPFIVKINGQHYHKLRRLFDKTFSYVDSQLTKDQIAHAFHAALFAVIVRYSTLAGGQQLKSLRGGGMQGAIHDTMFDCFTKWFGVSSNGGSGTECFASPFNSNIAQYYSAFPSPDIDGFFGSCGDFFSLHAKYLEPGWYEVNPPFSPGLMERMANRLIELLNAANTRNIDVAFIVIIPSCSQMNNDVASNRGQSASAERKEKKKQKKKRKRDRLNEEPLNTNANAFTHTIHHGASSSFNKLVNRCNCHIVLSKRDHGYVEGSQHLRPTQFKESQYDSSVIVLMSKSCTEIDIGTFEADVRDAFKSRHVAELQQRRGRG